MYRKESYLFMDNKVSSDVSNYFEIDVLHIIKVLWHRAWIIVLCMFLCGGSAFAYTGLFIAPEYKASAMIYVNNTSAGGISETISSSELSAAKSLVDIYIVILKSQTTLKQVIEQADLEYSPKTLSKMISAGPVDGTEVFSIKVTSQDPAEAELIANTLVDILPERISSIVKGSSVCVVDYADLPTERSSPSYTKNAIVGILLGMLASCGIIIVLDLLDTTIHEQDYLQQVYGLPLLAAVPDASDRRMGSYSAYYRQENEKAAKRSK